MLVVFVLMFVFVVLVFVVFVFVFVVGIRFFCTTGVIESLVEVMTSSGSIVVCCFAEVGRSGVDEN